MSELGRLKVRRFVDDGNSCQKITPREDDVWVNYVTSDPKYPDRMFIRLFFDNNEVIEIPLADFLSLIEDWHIQHWGKKGFLYNNDIDMVSVEPTAEKEEKP